MLVAADATNDFGDITCNSIGFRGCGTIGQSISQLDCLCAGDRSAFGGNDRLAASILEDFNVGILYLGRDSISLDILHQLACYLHLHAYFELRHAFRQVCPICFKDLAAILRVCHPEGLLVAADSTDNFSDIACDAIGLGRCCAVLQSLRQLYGFSTGHSLGLFIAAFARGVDGDDVSCAFAYCLGRVALEVDDLAADNYLVAHLDVVHSCELLLARAIDLECCEDDRAVALVDHLEGMVAILLDGGFVGLHIGDLTFDVVFFCGFDASFHFLYLRHDGSDVIGGSECAFAGRFDGGCGGVA